MGHPAAYIYIEDITWWRKDMNSYFQVVNALYLVLTRHLVDKATGHLLPRSTVPVNPVSIR